MPEVDELNTVPNLQWLIRLALDKNKIYANVYYETLKENK